ncbi:iron complex transport system substrate-binding protein [Mesorhizobium albiziae]|uniref:Iron complex transport system substrate-binding protein n=1 Tax=Neomesorhizobium albiziae TaxID=335020 RepID=A0A1I4DRH8_9HYPH|nr:iron-siderophore ABC transporter substrate-binding protein [Mesorhizobium albiziae]GLS31267.1 amino acid ABC transporter substrate-binding protein [Mesorhizobium albiziae]SFK94581.1 iron complex transport system substrate-binding protein [Mesorhizobium albiziae]
MTKGITRRSLLASTLIAGMMPGRLRAATPRLAVIDWGMLETSIAIGAQPAAGTELIQFRQVVVEPELPAGIADLGLRGTPNYELLRLVAPDLILISNFYEYQRAALERVAPVLSLPVYEAGKPPYPLAEQAAITLGATLGRRGPAEALVADTATFLAHCRNKLQPLAARPVFVISLGDHRHFRAFGADSMIGDVLTRLGLTNAWTDPTSYSAAAPVGLEALARKPGAAIVIVSPTPPNVARTLAENALWNALPAVRNGRVAVLAPINHFGGLPSAQRFARLILEAAAAWGGHG